jgi:hypothetical protein
VSAYDAEQLAALNERRDLLSACLQAMDDAAERERRVFTLEEMSFIAAIHDELRRLAARADALRAHRPRLTLVPRTPAAEPDDVSTRRAVSQ